MEPSFSWNKQQPHYKVSRRDDPPNEHACDRKGRQHISDHHSGILNRWNVYSWSSTRKGPLGITEVKDHVMISWTFSEKTPMVVHICLLPAPFLALYKKYDTCMAIVQESVDQHSSHNVPQGHYTNSALTRWHCIAITCYVQDLKFRFHTVWIVQHGATTLPFGYWAYARWQVQRYLMTWQEGWSL